MGFPTPSVAHHLKNPFEQNNLKPLIWNLCGLLLIEIKTIPENLLNVSTSSLSYIIN